MVNKLYYNTLNPLLLNVLKKLMAAREFDVFRLIGGTALSLYRGHRESADIDLFSDAPYDSINFAAIDTFLHNTYSYVDTTNVSIVGMGKSYFVGRSKNDCVKLDLFYTDRFIQEKVLIKGIRLATVDEIVAMKIDVISSGGRKKDFWDIHELKDEYSYERMIALHKQRYPYTHDENQIRKNFTDFKNADDDFDPVCLKGKHWEIIKLDIIDFAG
ncbi:MAG TPA: nucleotidyl transferase AbiEii/AbiGii toxin family protein [Bacteroidales bacterium]|nr:nucleotidyl transferase AbiEii/AbiGii toxin family protein [Bacteroidales bacterium]